MIFGDVQGMIVAVINLIFETKGSLKFLENCWDIFLSFSISIVDESFYVVVWKDFIFCTVQEAYSKIHLIYIYYNLTLQYFSFAYFTISCILIRQAALATLCFGKYREFFIKKSKSRNLICISYKGSCWNFDLLIPSTLSWMNYILGNCDVYMIFNVTR